MKKRIYLQIILIILGLSLTLEHQLTYGLLEYELICHGTYGIILMLIGFIPFSFEFKRFIKRKR